MENQIITPNIAYFKEGEVYVMQLPEFCNNDESCSIIDSCPKECSKYNEAVSYARAHAIKVHEKDKEKVKALIMASEAKKGMCVIVDEWLPQDLTEYRIEGLRMRIEETCSHGCINNNTLCINNGGSNEEDCCFYKQVACLIEDDGVKNKQTCSHNCVNMEGICYEKDCDRFKLESPSEEGKEDDTERADRYFNKFNEMFTLASKRTDEMNYWKKACDKWEEIYKNQITKITELESKLQKSDQEALANAWDLGFKTREEWIGLSTLEPKNPYTKD